MYASYYSSYSKKKTFVACTVLATIWSLIYISVMNIIFMLILLFIQEGYYRAQILYMC